MNAPAPGWQPDPTGRHEYRYWDGGTWTDDVSDNGVTSVDPFAGTGAFGGEATAPMDQTQSYPPQAGGFGPPGGAQPGFGPPSGPQSGGFGAPPGPPGYSPYGSGQLPPGRPPKSGPPVGLIVGLAVLALAVIAGLVFVLTSDDDDETSTDDTTQTTEADATTGDTSDETTATTEDTTGPEDADVFSLEVGDCLDEDTAGSEVDEVPLVPCEQSHVSEIFYSHMIDAPDLPDSAEMETIVTDVCLPEFESFVGLPYAESVLEVTWLEPTQGSWDSGDRELLCMVIDPAGPVTGSLAGANR